MRILQRTSADLALLIDKTFDYTGSYIKDVYLNDNGVEVLFSKSDKYLIDISFSTLQYLKDALWEYKKITINTGSQGMRLIGAEIINSKTFEKFIFKGNRAWVNLKSQKNLKKINKLHVEFDDVCIELPYRKIPIDLTSSYIKSRLVEFRGDAFLNICDTSQLVSPSVMFRLSGGDNIQLPHYNVDSNLNKIYVDHITHLNKSVDNVGHILICNSFLTHQTELGYVLLKHKGSPSPFDEYGFGSPEVSSVVWQRGKNVVWGSLDEYEYCLIPNEKIDYSLKILRYECT